MRACARAMYTTFSLRRKRRTTVRNLLAGAQCGQLEKNCRPTGSPAGRIRDWRSPVNLAAVVGVVLIVAIVMDWSVIFEPFAMMRFHPAMAVVDPPVTVVPDPMLVVVARGDRRGVSISGRIAVSGINRRGIALFEARRERKHSGYDQCGFGGQQDIAFHGCSPHLEIGASTVPDAGGRKT